MTTRREFLKTAGVAGAATALSTAPFIGGAKAGSGGKVIVVGGGFGGAVAARYVKHYDPAIEVTLIDSGKDYTTCVFSNLYLAGIRTIESITFDLSKQAERGINFVNDTVTAIDPVKKTVTTAGGQTMNYDRLVMSPGVSFKPMEGYDEAAMEEVPHAWKAGPQTVLLRKQIEAMEDGGVVVISSPPNPFRCPPGPYERASMIASYLKQHKPKSKVVILDAKDKFSKQGLFEEGWKQFYEGMIEWVSSANGGAVKSVDAKNRAAITEFETHKAAVLNVIPAQTAAQICHDAGLANDTGWCPIDYHTFESTLHKGIHVIGDASIADKMPKSGNAANTQAKACALAIVKELKGEKAGIPTTTNTCYSLITNDWAFSVTAVYKATPEGFDGVKGSGGLSPMIGKGADEKFRKQERGYADGWYDNIVKDSWT